MRQLLAVAVCGLLLSGAQAAETTPAADKPALQWFRGDCNVPAWPEAEFSPKQRTEQAAKGGLSWMIVPVGVHTATMANPATPDTLKKLSTGKFTPIVGLRWRKPLPISEDIISIGIDPELPLERSGAQDIIDWTNRQGGATIIANPSHKLERYAKVLEGFAAVEAFQNGKWNPECSMGSSWDKLLSRGMRLFIVGGTSEGTRPVLGRGGVANYVLARSNSAADIITAIRLGRVVVSERDNIRLKFTVDGQPPGSTVMPKKGRVEIAIDVEALEGVDEVLIVGNKHIKIRVAAERAPAKDGTKPKTKEIVVNRSVTFRSFRVNDKKAARTFTLSLGPETRYLRAYAVMQKGNCRTMTNPIFIGPKPPTPVPPDVKDRQVKFISTALRSLNWQKPKETKNVIEVLLDDHNVGVHTALALTEILDKKQLDVIRPLINSHRERVQTLTMFVLARLEGRAVLPQVLPIVTSGRTVTARTYAARMLIRFAEEEHAKVAVASAGDGSPDVRRSCYIVLAKFPSLASLAIFRKALRLDYVCAPTVVTQFHRLLGLDAKNRDSFTKAFMNGKIDDDLLNRAVPRKDLHKLLKEVAAVRLWSEAPPPWLKPPSKADPKFPRLVAVAPEQPPVIDGKIDRKIWDAAKSMSKFVLEDGKPAKQQTRVRALYDKQALYLLIECDEPAPKQIVANEKAFDANVWLDDSVDIYICPSGNRGKRNPRYFRLSVNSLGTRFDEERRRRHWNAPWSAAATVGEKTWQVEIKVPFSSLETKTPNKDTTLWLINVARHRRVKPGEESSLLPGDLRQPAKHATLEFK